MIPILPFLINSFLMHIHIHIYIYIYIIYTHTHTHTHTTVYVPNMHMKIYVVLSSYGRRQNKVNVV